MRNQQLLFVYPGRDGVGWGGRRQAHAWYFLKVDILSVACMKFVSTIYGMWNSFVDQLLTLARESHLTRLLWKLSWIHFSHVLLMLVVYWWWKMYCQRPTFNLITLEKPRICLSYVSRKSLWLVLKLWGVILSGIARCFTFGGSRHRVLHDPKIPPRSDLTKQEYMKKDEQTTVNHFHEKLLKLKNLMKTKVILVSYRPYLFSYCKENEQWPADIVSFLFIVLLVSY